MAQNASQTFSQTVFGTGTGDGVDTFDKNLISKKSSQIIEIPEVLKIEKDFFQNKACPLFSLRENKKMGTSGSKSIFFLNSFPNCVWDRKACYQNFFWYKHRFGKNCYCIQLGLNQRRLKRSRIMSAVQSTTLPWMLHFCLSPNK